MRSEPEGWSARVMMARPPAFSTAVAMVSSSVGDHDRAEPGRLGAAEHLHDHRQAGDIGQRLAGQPGRGHAGRDEDEERMARIRRRLAEMSRPRYTGCQRRGKPGICAPPRGPCGPAVPPVQQEPIRDGFLRTQQVLGAVLGTCLALLSLNIAAGAIFASHEPEKPGYEIAVQEQTATASRAKPAPPRSRCRFDLPAPMSAAARIRQEMRRLPHLRQGRAQPRRPQSLRHRRPSEGSEAGFNYSAAMKAQSGNWTPEDLDKLPDQSQGHGARHQYDLRRHSARQGARRFDHLSQQQVGQAGRRCPSRPRRAPPEAAAGSDAKPRRLPAAPKPTERGTNRRHHRERPAAVAWPLPAN